jgi:hypothetical protein
MRVDIALHPAFLRMQLQKNFRGLEKASEVLSPLGGPSFDAHPQYVL